MNLCIYCLGSRAGIVVFSNCVLFGVARQHPINKSNVHLNVIGAVAFCCNGPFRASLISSALGSGEKTE